MGSPGNVVPLLVVVALAAAGCNAAPPRTAPEDLPLAMEEPTPSPAATQQTEPEQAPLPHFSRRKAMRHVRKLAAEIGVRVRGRRGERAAALYVRRRFKALGYEVKVQRFEVDGGRTSRNVVAWWPGARPYGVVVGGHMDSVPGSPGANDNASGVAVVLEMARIFAGRRPSKFVRFVAFGSEEFGADGTHHVGSEVYVRRLGPRGRKRLAGMVSVDMVADGRPLIVGTSGIAHPIVARTLYNKIDAARVKVSYRDICDCSDNGPFEHAGIPAAFAWSGSEPDYHSPTDTVPNMSRDDLERTGRAMKAFVRAVRKKMLERFRTRGR